MKTLKQLERLRRIHELIKQANTGNPKELAIQINISERQVYNCIEYLKEVEAPIVYNRKTNTYYYTADFDLLVNVSVQVMINEEIRNIYAGHTALHESFISCDLSTLY